VLVFGHTSVQEVSVGSKYDEVNFLEFSLEVFFGDFGTSFEEDVLSVEIPLSLLVRLKDTILFTFGLE
jgi:hypothetical protein